MTVRICHVTTVHTATDVRIAHKELATLAAGGYEAWLIAYGDSSDRQRLETLGIRFESLGERGKGSRLRRLLHGYWAALKASRRLDARLYHLHDPELIGLGLLLKLTGRKVVMDVHEDLALQITSKPWVWRPLRRAIGQGFRRLEWFCARVFDAVVTATPGIEKVFSGRARRVLTINNFPKRSEFPDSSASVPWSQRRYAVYAGGIARMRGIVGMVDAIERTDTELLLLGNYLTDADRVAAASRPGFAKVRALGYLDREGVRAQFERAFVGLCVLLPIPNYLESQPIKLFEYMAAGIPVIASDFPAWRQVIDTHRCGLCVDPGDAAAIAAAIESLRRDLATAQAMGERGRQAVLAHYHWEAEQPRLLALYDDLTGKR